MTRKRTEDRSLETYYKWLKLKKWDTNYHHFPNELPANNKSMQIFAANLKRKGKKSGFSDIVILEQHQGYGALFIELKTLKGSPTLHQLAFLHNVNNNGYLGCVAYGLDAAIEITEWYMGNKTSPIPLIKRKRKRNNIEFDVLEIGK